MANNRLIIVNKSTGRAVVIAKSFNTEWITVENIEKNLDEFFNDTYYDKDDGIIRDDLCLCVEAKGLDFFGQDGDMKEVETYERDENGKLFVEAIDETTN